MNEMSSNQGRSQEGSPQQLTDWIQVDASHYDPMKYLSPARMASVGYQFRFVHEHFPGSCVLEVGPGGGLTTSILRQLGHEVQTMDVDDQLSPDVLGSITDIPCPDEAYDSFLCCQVLEHLEWDDSQKAIAELGRVVKHGGVLSVPTVEPCLALKLHAWGRFGFRRFRLPPLRKTKLLCPDQHAWELGCGVSVEQFRSALRTANFRIEQELQPLENSYHHFFVVRKSSS